MKLAKKLLAVALAGVMAVSMLAGCSSSGVSTASLAKAASEKLGYTVTANSALTNRAKNEVKNAIDQVVADKQNTSYKNVLLKDREDNLSNPEKWKIMQAAGGGKNGVYKDRKVFVILAEVSSTSLNTQRDKLVEVMGKQVNSNELQNYTPGAYTQHRDAQIGSTTIKDSKTGKTYLLAIVTFAKDN